MVCVLMVGDLHNGNAIVKSNVQSAMTVKVFHTANNPLLLLAYSRLLVHVICSSLGLTALIGELCR